MVVLEFTVTKQNLVLDTDVSSLIPVSDTINYLKCEFTFDETWDDFDKRVYFKNESYNVVRASLLDSNNSCYIPWEVIAHTGVINCNVVGLQIVNDTVVKRLTTNPVNFLIQVDESVLTPYDQAPFTPTEYEQFRASVNSIYLDTVSAKNDAITAKNDTQTLVNTVIGIESQTKEYEETSEAYAIGTRNGVAVTSGDVAYHNNSAYHALNASNSANSASSFKLDSEAFALGTRNSVSVGSSDPAYHNNSKYYKDIASASAANASTSEINADTSALIAEGYSVGKQNGTDVSSGTYYHNNAKYYSGQSSSSATSASSSASSASNSAKDAEAYAIGKRNGVDVTSGDPAFHNNSKYYSDSAQGVFDAVTIKENASGTIASFDDGADDVTMKKCEVALNPIQSLNGYSSPWVGGAGKNKMPMVLADLKSNNTSGTWSGNVYTYHDFTFTVNVDSADNVISIKVNGTGYSANKTRFTLGYPTLTSGVTYTLSGAPSGYSGTNATIYLGNSTSTIGISNPAMSDGNPVTFTPTQTGAPTANINIDENVAVTNALFYPQIEIGNSPTAFEPYSNICPISGRNSVDTYVSGKNLLHHIDTTNTVSTVVFTVNADGTIKANGTATANAEHTMTYRVSGTYATTWLKAGTYKLLGCPSGGGSNKYEIGINTTINGSAVTLARDYGSGATFTLENDGLVGTWCTVRNGVTVDNITFKPMIVLSTETDTTYEKYNGTTYTTALGTTVYGGTLDLISGLLTVTHAIVDMGTLTYGKTSSPTSGGVYRFYSSGLSNVIKIPSAVSVVPNMLCSAYKTTTFDDSTASVTGVSINAIGSVFVTDPVLSSGTATDAKTALNGVQLVYELATPTTTTLTPRQVQTLLGTNNVWSTGGDVSVVYVADTKLYIDNAIANL